MCAAPFDFSQPLDSVLDTLASYFAFQRKSLRLIPRIGDGNRFEGWLKWEAAVALHELSQIDTSNKDDGDTLTIGNVAVEVNPNVADCHAAGCDLFIGVNPRLEGGYHERDTWVELKARSTSDNAGVAGLQHDIVAAIENQTCRANHMPGSFLVVAMIAESPEGGRCNDWVAQLVENVAGVDELAVRRIHLGEQRTPGEGADDRLLAALIGWNCTPRG